MRTKISRTIDRTVLENGVRVISSYMKGETVAFAFGFDHGAIFDPSEFDGLSHAVEHFLLKAAPGYPYRRASRLCEECGLVSAQTKKFRILVPALVVVGGRQKKNFKRTFRVLSKLVSEPTFNEHDFELEKDAIIHEIEETEADPSWQAYEFLFETLFGKESPLARTIIGKADIIRSIDRETLIGFCRSLFDPKRIIILSHGNIRHHEVVNAAESFFQRREKRIKTEALLTEQVSTSIESCPSRSPVFQYDKIKELIDQSFPGEVITRPEPQKDDKLPEDLGGVAIGCRLPPLLGEERYAIEVLKCILGGGILEDSTLYSGDLFYELREKRGLIYHPDVIQYENSLWGGCFYFNFKTNQALLEKAEKVALDLFRSYKNYGISRAAVESAQKKIASHFSIFRAKHDFDFLDWMLASEIAGKPQEPDEFVRNIKKVTKTDVNEILKKYFDPETQLVRALVYPAQT